MPDRTRQTPKRETAPEAPAVSLILCGDPEAPVAEIAAALRESGVVDPDIHTLTHDIKALAACCERIRPDIGVLYTDAQTGAGGTIPQHAFLLQLLGATRFLLIVGGQLTQSRLDEITRAFAAHVDRTDLGDAATAALDMRKIATGLRRLLADDRATRGDRLRVRVESAARTDGRVWKCVGRVESGILLPDTTVTLFPTEQAGRIVGTEILELPNDDGGQNASFEIETDALIGTGQFLAAGEAMPDVSDQIAAHVIWTGRQRLYPGRTYRLRLGSETVAATITALKHRVGADHLAPHAARFLDAGEIGFCNLALDRPIVFDSDPQLPATHRFRLFDHDDGETLGLGFITYGLRRATNLTRQEIAVGGAARAAMKGQKPCVIWFTGLSGAGKSSVASAVDQQLHALGRHTYLLDGDNVRHGLCRDLGFTEADRVENIRRVAEVARLMVDAGLIVLTSFISPFRSERQMARDLFPNEQFIEIFMDTPLAVCEARDIKGLYRKARAGELVNFTGIDSPYEVPETPDIRLQPDDGAAETQATKIIQFLQSRGII